MTEKGKLNMPSQYATAVKQWITLVEYRRVKRCPFQAFRQNGVSTCHICASFFPKVRDDRQCPCTADYSTGYVIKKVKKLIKQYNAERGIN